MMYALSKRLSREEAVQVIKLVTSLHLQPIQRVLISLGLTQILHATH